MSEIVLDRVSKVFDDGYEAVKEMNLDIADGEYQVDGRSKQSGLQRSSGRCVCMA